MALHPPHKLNKENGSNSDKGSRRICFFFLEPSLLLPYSTEYFLRIAHANGMGTTTTKGTTNHHHRHHIRGIKMSTPVTTTLNRFFLLTAAALTTTITPHNGNAIPRTTDTPLVVVGVFLFTNFYSLALNNDDVLQYDSPLFF